jgi:hypothetical protein
VGVAQMLFQDPNIMNLLFAARYRAMQGIDGTCTLDNMCLALTKKAAQGQCTKKK